MEGGGTDELTGSGTDVLQGWQALRGVGLATLVDVG